MAFKSFPSSCFLTLLFSLVAIPTDSRCETIDFNRDIRPILSSNCLMCHGPDESSREAGLRLDLRESATEIAIDVEDPDSSELLARIVSDDPDTVMPPPAHAAALSTDQIGLLTKWIEQGANYDKHWSYKTPQKSPPPEISTSTTNHQSVRTGRFENEIDAFVIAKLRQRGMQPSKPATKHSILRRLHLDLIGLPPTPEEVENFVNDQSSDAYERVVDDLLARDSYGERWASVWLDLARYADSAGFAEDRPRTIWPYRDWVIQAYNTNMPFDQFTIEQLAGDLLPSPDLSTKIATAFHRNTLTNSEGGTSDEEFRSAAVVDRVNTTMAVWMGMTMACAQCHTHKYDPITQEEYFQLYDFLNQTADNDHPDERPVLKKYSKDAEERLSKLNLQIAKKEKERSESPADDEFDRWVADRNSENETEAKEDADALREEFLNYVTAKLNDEIAKLKKRREAIKPEFTVPVMREVTDENRRVTKIHLRGSYLNTGDTVTAGTPAALHEFPENEPPSRLSLARWLVAKENPLTARVVVNRYWEQLFGIGIVATSEEFGSQGELPSHPKLLDWLAVDLMENGWDTRSLLKKMVMSATYRQSSVADPTSLEADPNNRLLARGPRVRLSAEMIRDQALAVSGLLSHKMFGPPVQPPAPKIGLRPAFTGKTTDWTDSVGEDRYRRGIYTEWRRSAPYPSMATFDMNSREVCEVRRINTNTPLQALVTLNDPVYVEAAQSLAKRIYNVAKVESTQSAADFAFRLCLIRPPSAQESQRMINLFDESKAHFADNAQDAEQLAVDPLNPPPTDTDYVELAAWVTVSNVLLNLDEMLMKP